ncbi:PLP-dependent aminotransferase family protein [Entomohabitans teleogrylli]|uniref:aminotransferase-like domain-containing protein n=1 Tax=Entomohabitans teleogrylli TaxID=1384589 RepID=UPI00073D6083|nr:PLP-dependent aminotransferase family protein [Entomohabitans teleogrylli]
MLIPVNPDAEMPLYLQVACSIKKYLESHPTGHKLPSQRHIATLLQVSKTTVVEAFNVLADDGVITTREKSRAVSSLKAPGIDWPLIIHKARQSRARDDAAEPHGSAYSKSLLMWPGMDFSPQTPLMEVSEAVSRRIASADFMNYDDIGFLQLRELLAQHLKSRLAISCSPEDIVITSGISNALYIIACAFFGRFAPVMYEAPGYYTSILTSQGAPAIPIPMGADGISPQVLQNHIARHRHAFFLTTPLDHWPTCHMTSEANKQAQYAMCRRHDIPVIEIDAMRGLFDAPLPMRSYPGAESSVIYIGTFTNTIGHSMRLAWIVAPRNTVKRLLEVKSQVEPRISNLIQIYAEEILRSGAYHRYLDTLQHRVLARNQGIEEMLRRHLGAKAIWQGQPGVSRMITLDCPPDASAVIRMQGRQISLLPLGALDSTYANSLYMYCAADSLPNTEALIRRLSQLCTR